MPISYQSSLLFRSCPWWTTIIPGSGISLYWLDNYLPLRPPISYLTLSIYMNPKDRSLPCFLIYCQPSIHFRNVNIGEQDIFAVISMKKEQQPDLFLLSLSCIHCPPPLPHPSFYHSYKSLFLYSLTIFNLYLNLYISILSITTYPLTNLIYYSLSFPLLYPTFLYPPLISSPLLSYNILYPPILYSTKYQCRPPWTL